MQILCWHLCLISRILALCFLRTRKEPFIEFPKRKVILAIVDNGTTFNYDGHLDIYKMYLVKLLEKVYSKFKHIKVMPFVKLGI